MSSGMFRGKEFSNRIKLSQLVQDLLSVIWAPCSSGGQGRWVSGHLGHVGAPRHVHTCVLTCTHEMLKSTC